MTLKAGESEFSPKQHGFRRAAGEYFEVLGLKYRKHSAVVDLGREKWKGKGFPCIDDFVGDR